MTRGWGPEGHLGHRLLSICDGHLRTLHDYSLILAGCLPGNAKSYANEVKC